MIVSDEVAVVSSSGAIYPELLQSISGLESIDKIGKQPFQDLHSRIYRCNFCLTREVILR